MPGRVSLGFGVLSWKGHASLARALETYRAAGLLDLFDRTLLFLPEMDPQGVALAARFGLPYAGSERNLGILGGFKALARALEADVLVLAENDYPLIESREEARRQLAFAHAALESRQAQVWRLRHRARPGQTWAIRKAEAYWPRPEASAAARVQAALRRSLRPAKARRMSGWTIFYDDRAADRFPKDVRLTPEGAFLVSSRVLPWANNVFMIRRDFFLDVVLPAAERSIGGRLVNGFPSIETELNRGWWRAQDFWIGQDRGLFTHERADDRGY